MYKRILTIQDISCVGQCSLTVALPVLSVCGVEACALPSAVLSTHSGGFHGYTFRDLTEDIPAIWHHWQREGISFDGIYTGYLGSTRQMELISELFQNVLASGGKRIIDPAMADNGKLYAGFDGAYVAAMGEFCRQGDLLLPNLTEACLLTGTPFRPDPEVEEVRRLLEKLHDLCSGDVMLTGVGLRPGETGFALWEAGEIRFYSHPRIPGGYHGTGDLFASALVGAWMGGRPLYDAGGIAADFVAECVAQTRREPAHRYGVRFEAALPKLMERLK